MVRKKYKQVIIFEKYSPSHFQYFYFQPLLLNIIDICEIIVNTVNVIATFNKELLLF